MQRWNNPKHDAHTRSEPDARAAFVSSEADGDRSVDRSTIRCPAGDRNRGGERRRGAGVSAGGSDVQVHTDGSVHVAPGDVHRHHDSAVRRGARGMLCYYAVDLLRCCRRTGSLVCRFHVDLVALMIQTANIYSIFSDLCN